MLTTLLFAVYIINASGRYYARIGIQKEFGLDDAFLAFGTACMTTAMVVLYINMNDVYSTEALTCAPNCFISQAPDLSRVFEFRKLVRTTFTLT